MEVVASELFSARVAVSPKPSESDPSKVPTDPSRGRYKAAKDFGAPYGERLCKLVRTFCSVTTQDLTLIACIGMSVGVPIVLHSSLSIFIERTEGCRKLELNLVFSPCRGFGL